MAYRRRLSRRVGFRRRRVVRRKGARRTTMGRRRVSRRIQPTRGFVGAAANARYFDVSNTYYLNSTGSVTHLDVVPTGTTVNSREGKAFQVTSCELRGTISSRASTTTAAGRIHLVWDEQPNKAAATITDIFDTASSNSLLKRENISRFRILGSWVYMCCGSGTSVTTDAAAFIVDRCVATPRCVACCTSGDNSGVIGNRISGALLLVLQGDSSSSGSVDLVSNLNVRVNFQDIRS